MNNCVKEINIGFMPERYDWYQFLACLKYNKEYRYVNGYERKTVKNILLGTIYGLISKNVDIENLQLKAVLGYDSYDLVRSDDSVIVKLYNKES